ncbi:hypothetical protein CSUI_011478, partial [Cystoisospora suis]
ANAGERKGAPSVLTDAPTSAFPLLQTGGETNAYQNAHVSRCLPRQSHMMHRAEEENRSTYNASSSPSYTNQSSSPSHQHLASLSPSPSSSHMKTDQIM